ncbi:MAG: hypothetical protein ACK5M1_10625 [Xanthomarina gelatinilytica]|uniref:hypothetical protein n=1 Tax=Xanthomarina gelatinilytica TaxID=1137281 RepID=UPI003A86083E
MRLYRPNSLTNQQLKTFHNIFEAHFGHRLSDEEATKEGLELISFIATIIESKYNN